MRARFFCALLLLVTASSCKHEIETFPSASLSDYLPLSVGKYITYQLDSTVFTNLGQNEELHHYQEKQEVAEQFADNLGRPSFRINRYIRTADSLDWQVVGTFFITPLDKTVEVVEDNLRTVRLALPIKQGFSWKGNQYLPYAPYGNLYDFQSDINFDPSTWDFTYESIDDTLSLNGQTLSNVVTVKQVDDETSWGDSSLITNKTFSEDKYAKGIGLVYQELIMRERNPNTGDTGSFQVGFGVKRTMLEHN